MDFSKCAFSCNIQGNEVVNIDIPVYNNANFNSRRRGGGKACSDKQVRHHELAFHNTLNNSINR